MGGDRFGERSGGLSLLTKLSAQFRYILQKLSTSSSIILDIALNS
jgi:hypothetical protein